MRAAGGSSASPPLLPRSDLDFLPMPGSLFFPNQRRLLEGRSAGHKGLSCSTLGPIGRSPWAPSCQQC